MRDSSPTEEPGKVAGQRFVTVGVPLLVGQAREPEELRLAIRDTSDSLVAIPAQFRVLARWWRADNSIRWTLVDFAASFNAGESKIFVLTDAKLPAPTATPIAKAIETPETIVVTTGPARFVVNRKKFVLFDSAIVDANGDGKFASDEELLEASPELGTVVEDTFGEKYYSSESTRKVEVLENGPLRVRVRAQGVHKAREGKGYSRGMYQYDVLMDFNAGSSAVFMDVVLGNNFVQSIGSPTFEDASLWFTLRGGIGEYWIAGDKPYEGELTADQSVCLYQDSNGADTWKKCQGYNTERKDYWQFPEGLTSSFRGYKLWRRSHGKEEELAAGNQARGTTRVSGRSGGVVLHLLNFWQQFPKAVEVFADGRVRLAFFPREYKVPHFLEDASAKGHEVVLHFFAKEKPQPDQIAALWEARVFPRPPLEHIAACGALADTGPFTVPVSGLDSKPNNRTAAYDPRMLSEDGLYGNAYGWQIFGERWRSCGGHSTRGARQPMKEDNYLYLWYVTGSRGWLLAGDARSRHFRDVRCYRIEDQDPFGFKDWNDFRRFNRSEDWTNRSQPNDEEARRYSQGRYPRATFWLPNPEHCVLDLPYDRYLLMGDLRSFENLPIIAAHGGYYAAYQKQGVHRATGWSWRACFRYWELTGDKGAERLLKATIAGFKALTAEEIQFPMNQKDEKTGKQPVNWWFTYVFCRAAAMTALHTSDPDALEICRRLADAVAAARSENPEGYYPADFAEFYGVLYHLTGEEKYKTLGLGDDNGESLKRVTGGMKLPACGHWLLHQPPRRK